MFLEREKRSPTRCTYYEARGLAGPVRAGEELDRYPGFPILGVFNRKTYVDVPNNLELIAPAPVPVKSLVETVKRSRPGMRR